MSTRILLELQRVLLTTDFNTVKSFVRLYELKPESSDLTTVCFQLFVDNLEDRYEKKFKDCFTVLSVKLDDLAEEVIEMDGSNTPQHRSPESERRRNLGKMRRDAGDFACRRMVEVSALTKHVKNLAEITKLGDNDQANAATRKENERHAQYPAGRKSASPIKQIDHE